MGDDDEGEEGSDRGSSPVDNLTGKSLEGAEKDSDLSSVKTIENLVESSKTDVELCSEGQDSISRGSSVELSGTRYRTISRYTSRFCDRETSRNGRERVNIFKNRPGIYFEREIF